MSYKYFPMIPLAAWIIFFLPSLVQCIPVPEVLESSVAVDDILRRFNVSREHIEAFRQNLVVNSATSLQQHRGSSSTEGPLESKPISNPEHHPRQQHDHQFEIPLTALSAQQVIRNSAAIQRKQEVFRQVMGFVNQNGRPSQQMPTSFSSTVQPPTQRHPYDNSNHQSNVGRAVYIKPSCEIPRNTDEDTWISSTSTTAASSLHLFFNVSGVQAHTRQGYQLYVIGAKLRLHKYAEGESQWSSTGESTSSELGSEPEHYELPLQPVPFFGPMTTPSDEEKIRVSVHNYTRPLKRHRAHKKKLLDSQMTLAKEEDYMELDVKLAARWWLVPGGRNFGLSVEVEDTDGHRKPANLFFRSRNCNSSIDGASRTDDDVSSEPIDIAWPMLELVIVEIPEGRHVVELPPQPALGGGIKERIDESENNAGDDTEASSDEFPLRKHRHHPVNRSHSSTQEEQADEAVITRVIHNQLSNKTAPTPTDSDSGHHSHSARTPLPATTTTTHRYNSHFYRQSSPAPTLATLEDHDLFKEAFDEGVTSRSRPEIDEVRMIQKPATSKFIQRMIMSQQQQHSRPRKEERNTKRVILLDNSSTV